MEKVRAAIDSGLPEQHRSSINIASINKGASIHPENRTA
jgi:hypothetical protein